MSTSRFETYAGRSSRRRLSPETTDQDAVLDRIDHLDRIDLHGVKETRSGARYCNQMVLSGDIIHSRHQTCLTARNWSRPHSPGGMQWLDGRIHNHDAHRECHHDGARVKQAPRLGRFGRTWARSSWSADRVCWWVFCMDLLTRFHLLSHLRLFSHDTLCMYRGRGECSLTRRMALLVKRLTVRYQHV